MTKIYTHVGIDYGTDDTTAEIFFRVLPNEEIEITNWYKYNNTIDLVKKSDGSYGDIMETAK